MSTEQNKALAKRAWEEMFNQKNIDVVDELFACPSQKLDPIGIRR